MRQRHKGCRRLAPHSGVEIMSIKKRSVAKSNQGAYSATRSATNSATKKLRMPELDGVGTIKEIRASDEKARIVVLTTFDGDEDIYRAIQAGAKGYLLKDAPRETLMDFIRRAHAGETCVPVHLAAKLAERVSGKTVSERESDVLKLMAQGKSNKQISSA